MKKVLLAGLFIFGILINFTFAKEQLFKPENIYKYNLKNLETDLKKDYKEGECGLGTNIDCNAYQLDRTSDSSVKNYVKLLKDKKYTDAANLVNKNLAPNTYTMMNFPIRLENAAYKNYGSVAYHEGILGLEQNGQDTDIKFYYIVIKNNTIYKFKSNTSMYLQNADKEGISNSKIQIGNGPIFEIGMKTDTGGSKYIVDDSRLLKYLQGKEKSKELDEFQNAFKAKVKKLFK